MARLRTSLVSAIESATNEYEKGNISMETAAHKAALKYNEKENEEILRGLQKEYIEAGSDVVYAPTFSANRIKLDEYGISDRIEEINEKHPLR